MSAIAHNSYRHYAGADRSWRVRHGHNGVVVVRGACLGCARQAAHTAGIADGAIVSIHAVR